jgi:hypothetical protein
MTCTHFVERAVPLSPKMWLAVRAHFGYPELWVAKLSHHPNQLVSLLEIDHAHERVIRCQGMPVASLHVLIEFSNRTPPRARSVAGRDEST